MLAQRTARRVFVVDDDPHLLELLSLNLQADGLDVEPFDRGFAVTDRAAEQAPDVIVLDVMLPDRDGLSVLRELKSDARTRDIPVVLLTAKATDAEVWEGWVAGADYYITKPFDLDELLRFIDRIGRFD